jgi:hypothetical protein
LSILQQIRDGQVPDPQLGYLHIYDYDELERENRAPVGEFKVSSALTVVGRAGIDASPESLIVIGAAS